MASASLGVLHRVDALGPALERADQGEAARQAKKGTDGERGHIARIQPHVGEQRPRRKRLGRRRHARGHVGGELAVVASFEPDAQVARAEVHGAADLDVGLTVPRTDGERAVGAGADASGEADQPLGGGTESAPPGADVPAVGEGNRQTGLGVAPVHDFGLTGLNPDRTGWIAQQRFEVGAGDRLGGESGSGHEPTDSQAGRQRSLEGGDPGVDRGTDVAAAGGNQGRRGGRVAEQGEQVVEDGVAVGQRRIGEGAAGGIAIVGAGLDLGLQRGQRRVELGEEGILRGGAGIDAGVARRRRDRCRSGLGRGRAEAGRTRRCCG